MSFFRPFLAAAMLATATASVVYAQPARAAQPAQDWTKTVTVGPSGRTRMGRPDAPVQLTAFASYSCGHCQDFVGYMPSIRSLVRMGLVNYEFHNGISGPFDAAASLVAHCTARSRFFDVTEAIYAAKMNLVAAQYLLATETQSAVRRGKKPSEAQLLDRAAEHSGLYGIAEKQGISKSAAKNCITDAAALAALNNHHKVMVERGAKKLPAFFVNGSLVNGNDFATLWPQLVKSIPVQKQTVEWQSSTTEDGYCRMIATYEDAALILQAFDDRVSFAAGDEDWANAGESKLPVSLILEGVSATAQSDWNAANPLVRQVAWSDDLKTTLDDLGKAKIWSIAQGGAEPAVTRFSTGDGYAEASARMQACEAERQAKKMKA